MKLIDFLFKICYAPFQKESNGRIIAIVWLTPSLSFLLLGALNILLQFFSIDNTPTVIGFSGLVIGCIVVFGLYETYVKDNRFIRQTRYAILYALFIPILFIISLLLFVLSF